MHIRLFASCFFANVMTGTSSCGGILFSRSTATNANCSRPPPRHWGANWHCRRHHGESRQTFFCLRPVTTLLDVLWTPCGSLVFTGVSCPFFACTYSASVWRKKKKNLHASTKNWRPWGWRGTSSENKWPFKVTPISSPNTDSHFRTPSGKQRFVEPLSGRKN